jgi:DNA-binding MarR family transcriptional regulator
MYWFIAILVFMRDEEFEVLYEILRSPSISVNKLYAKLRGRVSKVKLIELVRRLREAGLVKAVSDPRHKQRLMLFLREDIQGLAQSLLVKTINGGSDVVREVERLVRTYIEAASKVRDPVAVEFLRKLVSEQVDSLLSAYPR